MDGTPVPNSIRKRLGMQNEVLKWLEEFSGKLEKRAETAISEVNGLLDQAGYLEVDLQNTLNAFRNLSNYRFVDHASTTPDGISDEDDEIHNVKESTKSLDEGEIPAQSYVDDILPRYKEALSLCSTSAKNYLQRKKNHHSTTSSFITGSAHGSLPHIIGSEEYVHDNSCGLTENFTLGSSPYDSSHISEPNGVSTDGAQYDPPDLFSPNMFGTQEGPSEKDENEPLVSAALEFKAMLEAALLSPYKFDDEVNLPAQDAAPSCRSTEQLRNDVDSIEPRSPPQAVQFGSSDLLNVMEEKRIPVPDENLTSIQGSDVHDHKFFSALVSGSLFDNEEDSFPSSQVHDANLPASAETSTSGHAEVFHNNEFVLNMHFESSSEVPGSCSYKDHEDTDVVSAHAFIFGDEKSLDADTSEGDAGSCSNKDHEDTDAVSANIFRDEKSLDADASEEDTDSRREFRTGQF